jgi:hypothetical protein
MFHDDSTAAGASDPFSEAPARSTAAHLAREVARLEHREQESAERICRLKAALRMLLDDLTCRVKTRDPVPGTLRDFESVRREVSEALDD